MPSKVLEKVSAADMTNTTAVNMHHLKSYEKDLELEEEDTLLPFVLNYNFMEENARKEYKKECM